MEQDKLFEYH